MGTCLQLTEDFLEVVRAAAGYHCGVKEAVCLGYVEQVKVEYIFISLKVQVWAELCQAQ